MYRENWNANPVRHISSANAGYLFHYARQLHNGCLLTAESFCVCILFCVTVRSLRVAHMLDGVTRGHTWPVTSRVPHGGVDIQSHLIHGVSNSQMGC